MRNVVTHLCHYKSRWLHTCSLSICVRNNSTLQLEHKPLKLCPKWLFKRNPTDFKNFQIHVAQFRSTSFMKCPSENLKSESSGTSNTKPYLIANDPITDSELSQNMILHENFLSEEEEDSLMEEIQSFMKRLRYEYDHWDDAIHGYREVERRKWSDKNKPVLDRVRDIAFPKGVPQIAYVHVLDLEKTGYIKPHIDAVRFCGNTIAGLSLLSSSVMRLVHDKNKERYADILLQRRSLYIMKNTARFDYTHEVLGEKDSNFGNVHIPRDRRVSVIFRNEPDPDNTDNQ